jgi:hypothetical protein
VIPLRVPAIALLALFLVSARAPAGGDLPSAEGLHTFPQIAALAKGLERQLAQRGARVAIIGRIGLPPQMLPPGLEYSHAGFAVYSKIRTADNRLVPGYAVHNLYQGDARTGVSFLHQDYPVDYFSAVHVLKAGVVIPNEKLQRALAATMFSPTYKALHNPRYSALANPFRTEYQNCTGFVLDVLFAAIYRSGDPRRIKTNIAAYFEPQPIHVDALKLALADATMADVSTDDHTGPIATATFESIARFLLKNGIATEAFSFAVEPTTLYGATAPLAL